MLALERRFLLQIERPDTEDKGCERTQARGEEGDGRDEEGGGGREECINRKRVQLLPRASPPPPFPAGSACCLWPSFVYIPCERRALDDLLHDQGACSAASAQPGADTYLGAAAPHEKAAHMLVGATAEKPRRACCA